VIKGRIYRMNNKLTEKEISFIKKLYKNHEISHYTYMVIGFLGCIAILGIFLGMKFHSKDGFLMAIYLATISIGLLFKTKADAKIVKIMKKLLDNEKGSTLDSGEL